ncbi:MAG: hypothetical protein KC516_00015 [Nanoarchaeota archaeon]|nr:hypothetical protein [Nanoarchaeota archaeon]
MKIKFKGRAQRVLEEMAREGLVKKVNLNCLHDSNYIKKVAEIKREFDYLHRNSKRLAYEIESTTVEV